MSTGLVIEFVEYYKNICGMSIRKEIPNEVVFEFDNGQVRMKVVSHDTNALSVK
jgi:hypothetical protein